MPAPVKTNGKLRDRLASRVTLVEVDQTLADELEKRLPGSLVVERMPGVEQLLTASGLGTLSAEALVLGTELEEPLAVAERIHTLDKNIQIIVLCSDKVHDALQKKESVKRGHGDQVVIHSREDIAELPGVVKMAIKRARRRCSYRRNGHAQDTAEDTGSGQQEISHYLDNLLDHAPIGMLTVDRDGRILTLNRRARAILGVSESDVILTPVTRLFAAADQRRVDELLANAGQEADTDAAASFVLGADTDDRRYVEVTASAIDTRSGEPGAMVILHDVTDRVHAEQKRVRAAVALQASEDRFMELAEVMRMIPWESDPVTGRFTFVGEQAEEILGYPLEKWSEERFWSRTIHPEDRAWALDFCEHNRRRLQNYDFEYRMVAADGDIVWLHDVVNVVRNEEGTIVKLRGFMMDVTERKANEKSAAGHDAAG